MRIFIKIILISFPIFLVAQVGINTTNPDASSSLDINSAMTINFGGLQLPVVTETQRDLIQVNSNSEGTLVYVQYATYGCLEIYDGLYNQWQSILCTGSTGQTILYEEDFNSYATGTGINGAGNSGDYPAAVSKWTLNDVGNTITTGDYVETRANVLEINDTNGPVQLDTQLINIAGYSNVSFSVDVSGTGPLEYDSTLHSTDDTNTINDFVDVEYAINGGTFIKITDFNGNGTIHHTLVPYYTNGASNSAPYFPDSTVTQSGLSGNTLVIRITFQNWAGNEFFYIDNIVVTGN